MGWFTMSGHTEEDEVDDTPYVPDNSSDEEDDYYDEEMDIYYSGDED